MKTTDITKKIAERISGASEQVSNSVIDELASIEIAKRTKLVSESVKLIEQLENKLQLLEVCDVVTYDKDGVKQESYSETRFVKVKELKEGIAKVYDASDEALTLNNEDVFGKLQTVIDSSIIFLI
jgi:hypothetical protein